jgi:hypothetical protein
LFMILLVNCIELEQHKINFNKGGLINNTKDAIRFNYL